MARRASSGISPGLLIGIAAFVAVAFFGGKALLGRKSDSFTGTSPISMTDMLENGNSLRGNEYVIEGTVDEKLKWTADRGQIVSLKITTPAGSEYVGVEIPPDSKFSSLNIEREQRYSIKVKFRQGGIPVATDINRL